MDFLNNVLTAEWVLNMAAYSLAGLGLGWLFLRLFKQGAAPLRSAIVLVTMAALVVLPLLTLGLSASGCPLLRTRLPLALERAQATVPEAGFLEGTAGMIDVHSTVSGLDARFGLTAQARTALRIINFFGLLWVLGAGFLLLRFACGVLSLRRLKKEGLVPVRNSRVMRIIDGSRASLGGTVRAGICESPLVGCPLVMGFWRPVIIVPPGLLEGMCASEVRGMLLHELSHVRHRHHIAGILQRLVVILNWWNPLAHILNASLCRAMEEISDNHVLLESDSKTYAECLVNMAERLSFSNRLPVSIAMASPHLPLKDRVRHILSKERNMETRLRKRTMVMIVLVALLGLGLMAGIRVTFADPGSGIQEEARKAEESAQEHKAPKLLKKVAPVYPEEARKKGVEGEVVIDVTTDIEGRVDRLKVVKSVPELDQAAVDAVKQWVYEPLVVDGQPMSISFTVTVRFRLDKKKVEGRTDIGIESGVAPPKSDEKEMTQEPDETHIRAKGDIKPPKLIKKVEPVYPDEARKNDIQGVVILEATTDTEGRVEKVKILRSIPELNQAAEDAVKQWVYEPFVINGKPIGLVFTVTVRFKLKDKDEVGVSTEVEKEEEGAEVEKEQEAEEAQEILEDETHIRAKGDIKPPKLIKKVEPVYPDEARKNGIEGVVILEATTDTEGRVEKVKILRSIPELNQAAEDAVKQWIYEPFVINGKPIGLVFTVTVNFKLKDKK